MTEKFKQWEAFDEKCNTATGWLENMEQRIKDFTLKTTVDEKVEQRDKFQVIELFFNFVFWHVNFLELLFCIACVYAEFYFSSFNEILSLVIKSVP